MKVQQALAAVEDYGASLQGVFDMWTRSDSDARDARAHIAEYWPSLAKALDAFAATHTKYFDAVDK